MLDARRRGADRRLPVAERGGAAAARCPPARRDDLGRAAQGGLRERDAGRGAGQGRAGGVVLPADHGLDAALPRRIRATAARRSAAGQLRSAVSGAQPQRLSGAAGRADGHRVGADAGHQLSQRHAARPGAAARLGQGGRGAPGAAGRAGQDAVAALAGGVRVDLVEQVPGVGVAGAERGAVDLGPAELQADGRTGNVICGHRAAADRFLGEGGDVVADHAAGAGGAAAAAVRNRCRHTEVWL